MARIHRASNLRGIKSQVEDEIRRVNDLEVQYDKILKRLEITNERLIRLDKNPDNKFNLGSKDLIRITIEANNLLLQDLKKFL